jgi:hypothetical protein
MTEAQLQASILDLCRLRGLLAFHSRRNIGVGFPDLVIAGVGGVIFRELKNDTLQPTPEQMTWLGTLAEGGADAKLWRPSAWHLHEVADTLARLAQVRGGHVELTQAGKEAMEAAG